MKNETKIPLILILLISFQLFVIIIFGIEKESFHLDELYTYGLANSYYEPFLLWDDLSMKWNSPDFYNNYLTVQIGERFNYDSAYYNATKDWNPPLYSYCMHTVCSFFPNQFTKWYGICFNMVIFTGIIIVLYLLTKLIFDNKDIAILVCTAYGFSAGAISNAIYIRMYTMLTFFSVLTTYLHGLLVIRRSHKGIILAITIITALGFLTHYTFVVYAFFIFIGYEISLFLGKRWRAMLEYLIAISASITMSIVLFPVWISKISGGDFIGSNASSNLSMITEYLIRILIFIWFLMNGLFGGPVMFLLLLFALLILLISNKRKVSNCEWNILDMVDGYFQKLSNHNKYYFAAVFYATILTFLVMTKMSPYLDAYRYITLLYPNIIIITIFGGYLIIQIFIRNMKQAHKILFAAVLACALISYGIGCVDYLFKEKEDDLEIKISQYYKCDAYCVAQNTHNMTIAIPLLSRHQRSCYISCDKTAVDLMKMRTGDGKEKEPIVLYFPRWVKEGEPDIEVLNSILAKDGYSIFTELATKEESGLKTTVYVLE
ncbi:MAG: hypothetical protein ABRQ23_03345 [Syntrophomonadaceae bacterium]